MSLGATRARLEREAILEALTAHGWVIKHAARALGITVGVLEGRIAFHELTRPKLQRARPRCHVHRWKRVGIGQWVCEHCPATKALSKAVA